jgi:hypothetical protein
MRSLLMGAIAFRSIVWRWFRAGFVALLTYGRIFMIQRVHSLITSAVLGSAIGLVALAAPSQAASLGKYTFGTPTFSPPSFGFSTSPTGVAPGVSLSDFTAGAGLTIPLGGASIVGNPVYGIGASNWNGEATDYFEFTLTPDPGKKVTVNSLALDSVRIFGPRDLEIRSSLDNFAAVLGSTSVNSSFTNTVLPLSLSSSASIIFRILGTNTPTTGNQNLRFLILDNVELDGNIADIAAVPTPALLPGLVGIGVAAWRKRKGTAAETP